MQGASGQLLAHVVYVFTCDWAVSIHLCMESYDSASPSKLACAARDSNELIVLS